MTKWLEFSTPAGQIDRYKFTGISVNDFIDIILPFRDNLKDITEEEYESSKSHELEWNYNNTFCIERYVFRHTSKEARNNWNRRVRQIRREKFLDIINNEDDE